MAASAALCGRFPVSLRGVGSGPVYPKGAADVLSGAAVATDMAAMLKTGGACVLMLLSSVLERAAMSSGPSRSTVRSTRELIQDLNL